MYVMYVVYLFQTQFEYQSVDRMIVITQKMYICDIPVRRPQMSCHSSAFHDVQNHQVDIQAVATAFSFVSFSTLQKIDQEEMRDVAIIEMSLSCKYQCFFSCSIPKEMFEKFELSFQIVPQVKKRINEFSVTLGFSVTICCFFFPF